MIYGQEFFRCFTLKPEKSLRNRIAKLTVLLYLHDFGDTTLEHYLPRFVPNIRGSRGAKVLIHEAETYPDVNQGFDIGPGEDVAINVKQGMIKRKAHPYGQCTNEEFLDNVTKLSTSPTPWPRFKYGVNTAISRCQQLHTIKRCGCFDPYLPLTSEILYEYIVFRAPERIQMKSCYTLSGSTNSLSEVEQSIHCFERLSYDKECDNFVSPCQEKTYGFQLFEPPWPHESYELAFYNDIIKAEEDNTTIKFGDYFDAYEGIKEIFQENATEGFEVLKHEDLIEKNFIQLTVQIKVRIWLNIYLILPIHIYLQIPIIITRMVFPKKSTV